VLISVRLTRATLCVSAVFRVRKRTYALILEIFSHLKRQLILIADNVMCFITSQKVTVIWRLETWKESIVNSCIRHKILLILE